MSLPGAGRRVLVTRSASQTAKLSDALRSLGFIPAEVPVLEIVPPESYAPLDDALLHLDRFDWLVLTSTNTLRAINVRSQRFAVNPARARGLKVAAIGRATAEAARGFGFDVGLVPENYVAESLVDAFLKRQHNEFLKRQHNESGHDFSRAEEAGVLKGHDFSRAIDAPQENGALAPEGRLAGQRILIARAAVARDVIPDALRAAGAQVDVVDAYRNVMPESAPGHLRAAIEQGIDAATFTSSSSVTHLAEAAKAAAIAFPFTGVPAISIGPITSQTLRENGWGPAAEASPSDIPGLVQALAKYFASN